MILKAPFPYFGGKSRAASLVWARFGDVGNFIEPFAGSLAVLLGRPHAPRIETVNDADCYLANFWRALRADPEQVAHWCDWPVNECDLQARHRWLTEQPGFREKMKADPEFYDAKIAGWWVWGISQWIGAGWCSRPEWIGRGQGGRSPRGLNANIHLNGEMGIHAATAGHLDGQSKRHVLNRGSRGVTSSGGPGEAHFSAKRHNLSSNALGGIHSKLPLMSRSDQRGSQNPAILDWMFALSERLRRVRVCCGDWSRIVTPSCTWKLGGGQLTGVFLDPPYSHALRDKRIYSVEDDVAVDARAWAVENGDNPDLRIALCGLDGEHEMPTGWRAETWKAPRGYSVKAPRTEVIWFSRYCLPPQQQLFGEAS